MLWDIRLVATLLPILYGLVSAAYALVFFRNDELARRLAPRALLAAIVLHVFYLTRLAWHLQRVPLAPTFDSLSALALALGVAYFVHEKRSRTPYTCFIFVTLVFICQTVSSAFMNPTVEVKPILQNPLFGLHIAAALLGYAAFAV